MKSIRKPHSDMDLLQCVNEVWEWLDCLSQIDSSTGPEKLMAFEAKKALAYFGHQEKALSEKLLNMDLKKA